VAAAVSPPDGGLPALRVVSFTFTLGSLGVIALLVGRETRSIVSSLLASGLFAATYKLSGFWMDLARIDSMMLFLFLVGLFAATEPGRGRAVAAGLLFGAAFLTKQMAVFAIAPLLAAVIWHRRIDGLIQSATALSVAAVASLWWNTSSDGWYGYFVFTLPARHRFDPGLLIHFATDIFVLPICIAFVFAAWYALAPQSDITVEHKRVYVLSAAGAITGGALALSKWGGYLNSMLPPHALMCVLFGLGFHAALERIRSLPESLRPRLHLLVQFAALIQFTGLLFNPLPAVPTAQEARAVTSLVSRIRDLPGDVFMPDQPYLVSLAGKPSYAHEVMLADFLGHADAEIRDRLLSEISEAARSHRFGAVVGHPDLPVLENPFSYWPAISRHYVESRGDVPSSELLLRMDAGKFVQNKLFVPRVETH
jgi:hypothetical protein